MRAVERLVLRSPARRATRARPRPRRSAARGKACCRASRGGTAGATPGRGARPRGGARARARDRRSRARRVRRLGSARPGRTSSSSACSATVCALPEAPALEEREVELPQQHRVRRAIERRARRETASRVHRARAGAPRGHRLAQVVLGRTRPPAWLARTKCSTHAFFRPKRDWRDRDRRFARRLARRHGVVLRVCGPDAASRRRSSLRALVLVALARRARLRAQGDARGLRARRRQERRGQAEGRSA